MPMGPIVYPWLLCPGSFNLQAPAQVDLIGLGLVFHSGEGSGGSNDRCQGIPSADALSSPGADIAATRHPHTSLWCG